MMGLPLPRSSICLPEWPDTSSMMYVADTGNHTIRKITPGGTVSTFAGAAGQAGSADGTGGAARFSSPRAVAVDGQGNLYVADSGNAVLRKITSDGIVTTLAGAAAAAAADGSGANARFQAPVGIAIDGSGNLFVADAGGAVRKVTAAGAVSTFAGAMGEVGFTVADGTSARFTGITGVAVDGSGNVVVAQNQLGPGRVRRFDSQARPLSWGNTVDGVVNVLFPVNIAVDGAGTVYVATSGVAAVSPSLQAVSFNSIKMITPQGAVTTIAGSDDALVNGLVDGPGASARFRFPLGVAAGNAGSVIVADTQNDAIRLIDAQRIVSTLAGGAGAGLGGRAPRDGPLLCAAGHRRGCGRNALYRRGREPPGAADQPHRYGRHLELRFENSGTVRTQFGQALENVALDDRGVLYIAEASNSFGRNIYAAEPSGRLRSAFFDGPFWSP